MATFTNQATLSYNGRTTSSNIVTGEVTQVLTLWKDSTVDTYQAGDVLTYIVSIQNSGVSNYTNLTLTDNLGAYQFGATTLIPLTYTNDPILYYINGVLQTTPVVATQSPLVINNINVLAGSSTILVYRVLVNQYAPLATGSTIVNTATISGNGLTSDITATETVTINAEPVLTITKALNPQTIVENDQVTYTFTIQNTGNAPATQNAGIIINDTFSPILSNITVTLNGVTWPVTGNYTYNQITGLFSTIAGRITVPEATYTQNPTTGVWTITPGVTVLEVTGTI